MTDRCHWTKADDGTEVLIPMCCGRAVCGPVGCTCDVPQSAIEVAERGRQRAEFYIARLREKSIVRQEEVDRLFRENNRLRARIRELEANPC